MLTEQEREALDALEEAFGAKEVDVRILQRDPGFEIWTRSSIDGVLNFYARLKAVESVDWDAEMERRRLAEEKRQAERSVVSREANVLGFMTGLIPRLHKVLGWAEFESTDGEFFVRGAATDGTTVAMSYERATLKIITFIETTESESTYADSMQNYNGNASPRKQLDGYDAVCIFLDERSLAG